MKVLNYHNTPRINNNFVNPVFKSKKKIIQTGINEGMKIASAAISSVALAGIALHSKENKKEEFYPAIDELPKLSADDFIDDAIAVNEVLVKAGIAKSKGEGRRLIEQGGVSVDETKVSDPNMPVPATEFVLHKGKKVHLKIVIK